MRRPTGLRASGPGGIRLATASLAAVLVAVSGCAPSPVAFQGSTDIRYVEVALTDLPPMEAYYHRRQPPPPGLWGMLAATPYTFTGLTIYRSYADSKKTRRLKSHLLKLDAAEEMTASFVGTLRQAGVFRRVERRGGQGDLGYGGPYDARVELEVDRWGFTYATEGKLSAEAVVVGRMRPARGEKLLWRRRIVETDGARATLEELTSGGEALRAALRRTLQAAGADLARDLAAGLKPQNLLPPEL